MARTRDFHSGQLSAAKVANKEECGEAAPTKFWVRFPYRSLGSFGVTVTSQIVDLMPRVQLPYEPLFATWCNGNASLSYGGRFQFESESRNKAFLPGGVMVSISVFETDGVGSKPAPATRVVFSLIGKAPHCD